MMTELLMKLISDLKPSQISSSESIVLDVPNGMLYGYINARMMVNEEEVNVSNLEGDILNMGEVEDLRVYIYTSEDCSNGIDDDGDGLVDCDDPDCVNALITSIYINQTNRYRSYRWR